MKTNKGNQGKEEKEPFGISIDMDKEKSSEDILILWSIEYPKLQLWENLPLYWKLEELKK